MSLTKKIGELLIALDNATMTVFGDDAFITHIVPSPQYDDNGTLLDITISVFKSKYNDDNFNKKMEIWDALIYDSVFDYHKALSKVNIHFKEL